MNLYLEKEKKELCTGCRACENICPSGAITMDSDKEGFWYPVCNENVCLQCGKCEEVCPISERKTTEFGNRRKKHIHIYAAWSLNEETRYQSTSGGIFSELAMAVLDRGGSVCGAVYDERHMVRHVITDTRQDIKKLRQSKYVQSDMGTVCRGIKNCLKQNKMLLFCGTPCQCEGVLRYCREEKVDIEKLYLIDFICRGSNSPKVYRKFLEELEQRYQADITKVWFKNKTYGWNRFSTKIEFFNGAAYLRDRYHDTYIRGYIEENLYIRPSCAACRFKGFERNADITLADFWGVKLEGRMEESDGGTSMVMIHTNQGEKLWKAILPHLYWSEKELEEVVDGNVCFYHSVRQGKHREQFMADLDEMPVIENIERFLKRSDD